MDEKAIAARLAELEVQEKALDQTIFYHLGQAKEGERRLGLVQARMDELTALIEAGQKPDPPTGDDPPES